MLTRAAQFRAAAPLYEKPENALTPEHITVYQLCKAAELAFAKQFVTWLLSRYRCNVTDDEGDDLTEAAARSVDELY